MWRWFVPTDSITGISTPTGVRWRSCVGEEVVLLQEGFLTDSSFSNIVLGDASGLYTPDRPLLAGTRRAELLRTGRVTARPIRAEELEHYAYLWFVNAMVGLEDDLCFSVKNIRI